MLTQEQANRIRRLHDRGVSVRRIAQQTGHARDTVKKVLRGDWKPAELQDDSPFTGPAERCPECGAMVRMPCLHCRMAREKAIRQAVARECPVEYRTTFLHPKEGEAAELVIDGHRAWIENKPIDGRFTLIVVHPSDAMLRLTSEHPTDYDSGT